MGNFESLFSKKPAVIAVIHVGALPGTPKYQHKDAAIFAQVLEEAKTYTRAGVDAIMLENMHDIPYLKREVGHEISTMMSVLAYEVKKQSQLPCGIQILAGANKAALASAKAARLDFIRAEGFVFAHTADEGFMESDAGELLRYRKAIQAEDILIFNDIKKKHSSHAVTADVSIVETAHAAEFFLSDGLIVTGTATGSPANIEDINKVKSATSLPVLIGSGMNPKNLETFFPACDGFIVGSYFKKDGYWSNAVEEERVKTFMDKVKRMRGQNFEYITRRI